MPKVRTNTGMCHDHKKGNQNEISKDIDFPIEVFKESL
jgi:hypothetical protein